jgi:hypothetical protein
MSGFVQGTQDPWVIVVDGRVTRLQPPQEWLSCGCETLKDHWFHVDIGLCS